MIRRLRAWLHAWFAPVDPVLDLCDRMVWVEPEPPLTLLLRLATHRDDLLEDAIEDELQQILQEDESA